MRGVGGRALPRAFAYSTVIEPANMFIRTSVRKKHWHFQSYGRNSKEAIKLSRRNLKDCVAMIFFGVDPSHFPIALAKMDSSCFESENLRT
jgi:hypothetical protein